MTMIEYFVRQQDLPTVAGQQALREEIERHVEEFLARGGVIRKCNGASQPIKLPSQGYRSAEFLTIQQLQVLHDLTYRQVATLTSDPEFPGRVLWRGEIRWFKNEVKAWTLANNDRLQAVRKL